MRALGHLALLSDLQDGQRRAWLFTVLRNLKKDQDRHGRFEMTVQTLPVTTSEPDLPHWIEWEDLLNRLPSALRPIVIQRYWYGMNSREIAVQSGIADATVRSQLRRAIQLLRAELGESEHREMLHNESHHSKYQCTRSVERR